MEKLVISTELINGILQYLGNQPYAGVAGLIAAIQKEAASQMPAKAPEAPKEE